MNIQHSGTPSIRYEWMNIYYSGIPPVHYEFIQLVLHHILYLILRYDSAISLYINTQCSIHFLLRISINNNHIHRSIFNSSDTSNQGLLVKLCSYESIHTIYLSNSYHIYITFTHIKNNIPNHIRHNHNEFYLILYMSMPLCTINLS